MYDARRIVKLHECTCTCGRWQINGVPCAHACAATYMHKHEPEQYLDRYYMMAKYMQAYEPQIRVMLGPEEWPTTDGCDEIMLPIVIVQPRHPKKGRRWAPNEPTNPYKISRNGCVVTCVNCGVRGHNYKGCHLPLNPIRKRWNPKKRKTTRISSNVSVIY
jgi:hypothetical protein